MKFQYDDIKWIFSGIGAAVKTVLGSILFKTKRKKESDRENNRVQINTNKIKGSENVTINQNTNYINNSPNISKINEKIRINRELFQLILDNLSFRISLYKQAREKIIEVKYSGDVWWADDVQEILNAVQDKGHKLNKEINGLLNKLDEVSPVLRSNCENLVQYESEKCFVLGQYLVMPSDRAKRDLGYTFEEKFVKVIDDMEKGINIIKEQMDSILKEYENYVKH